MRLETALKPTGDYPPSRDVALVALLAALAYLLLPAWAGGQAHAGPEAVLIYSKAMLSYYLLPALGFLLALRRGAVDLSVWMAFSLGSLTSAWLLVHKLPPAAALPLGAVAGLVPGVLNMLLVRLRLPSLVASLVTAGILIVMLPRLFGSQPIHLPNDALESVLLRLGTGANGDFLVAQLSITRALLVAGICALVPMLLVRLDGQETARGVLNWGVVALVATVVGFALGVSGLMVLLGISLAVGLSLQHRPATAGPRREQWGLDASLVTSAVLSAAGGSLSLLDLGHAPIPTQLVGDLRIPVAAVLAGGWFLSGKGRLQLSAILLPPALLLATAWGPVWDLAYFGYPLQFALLGGGALVAQVAAHRFWRHGAAAGPASPAAALLAGMFLIVLAAGASAPAAGHLVARVVGTALGVASLLMLGLSLRRGWGKPKAALMGEPSLRS